MTQHHALILLLLHRCNQQSLIQLATQAMYYQCHCQLQSNNAQLLVMWYQINLHLIGGIQEPQQFRLTTCQLLGIRLPPPVQISFSLLSAQVALAIAPNSTQLW